MPARRRVLSALPLLLILASLVTPGAGWAANLIDFGGFDDPSDAVPWFSEFENPQVEWDPRDAQLSPQSGSLEVTSNTAIGNSGFASTRRCFLVTPGLRYQFRAETRIPSGQNRTAKAGVLLFFSATSNCNASLVLQADTNFVTAPGTWQRIETDLIEAPEDARSVSVFLGNSKIEDGGSVDVLFDNLELNEFTGDCVPSNTVLCLTGARFAVDVEWLTTQDTQGFGTPVPMTANSGLFWFFQASNLEVLVKVLDACTINDRFWVYLAATTDVNYRLTVTDTKTGSVRQYINPQGQRSAAVADSSAFPCS